MHHRPANDAVPTPSAPTDAPGAGVDLESETLSLSPFVTSASFWPPRLISSSSSWNEHVPFAGWIVETAEPGTLVDVGTNVGVSYFAFCEAVLRFGFATRCYGVDSWRGDSNSEHLEGAYESVLSINTRHYGGFSQLIRGTSADACELFDDASIDLLHLNENAAVDAEVEFNLWLPKLSRQAVVLLHGTNDQSAGSMSRLYAALLENHEGFEFAHGQGLGIVAVGSQTPLKLRPLFELDPSSSISYAIRETYRLLGDRLTLKAGVDDLTSLSSQLTGEVVELGDVVDDLRGRNSYLSELVARVRQAHKAANEAVLQARKQHRDQTEAFEDQVASLQSKIRILQQTLSRDRDRFGRVASAVAADALRIERSATWRLGRVLLAPVRLFRAARSTSPTRIQERVRPFQVKPDRPTRKKEALPSSPDLRGVIRDLERLLKSKRLSAGNLLGSAFESVTQRRGQRADLALGELLVSLREETEPAAPLDTLRRVVIELNKLERSRRWRAGQMLGNLVRGRRVAEPAIIRLQRTLPALIASLESGPLDLSTGDTWGDSFSEDERRRDEIYQRYIERVEEKTLGAYAVNEPADLMAFIVVDRAVADPALALKLVRTVSSVEAAGARPIVVGHSEYARQLRCDDVEGADGVQRLLATTGPDFICVLRPGDVVAPELPAALGNVGSAAAVVFDHDHIDWSGRRSAPNFKPGFSPDLLLEADYVGRGVAVRPVAFLDRAVNVLERGALRELLLRISEDGETVDRLPGILLHCPPGDSAADLTDTDLTRRVLRRRGAKASVLERPDATHVRYLVQGEPLVSIIIPFRDQPRLLRQCVESILRLTTWKNYELLLVDNQSMRPDTLALLGEFSSKPNVRVHRFDRPFNYSAANNEAVSVSRGDFLVFLNNDTCLLSPEWLEELIGYAAHPNIGAVGAKLFFASGRIQHAGVVIGLNGTAGHLLSGAHEVNVDPIYTRFTRNVSAVTGACLAVEREKFRSVGGFDETFHLTGSDVDLCLRLLSRGLRNVWTPEVQLFHFERESRRNVGVRHGDIVLSQARYEPHLHNGDPFFNPELSRMSARRLPRTSDETVGREAQRMWQLPRSPVNAVDGFVLAFDATPEDLTRNAELVAALDQRRPLRLDRATWFVPPFDHVYRGGIHTIMRLADALSRWENTRNQFVMVGRSSAEPESMTAQISAAFPSMRFEIVVVGQDADIAELPAADVAFATLWTSAFHLLRYNQTSAKFYLVQDYEPSFQAANATFGLAEQTYRFGFPGIANTPGVAERYRAYGNDTISFVPGVDRSIFRPPTTPRPQHPIKIVFYGRPQNARNGFELGAEALRKIKRKYGPAVEIYSVGAEFDESDFGLDGVLANVGVLPNLESVSEIYREAHIGLALMFTAHPSYQPFEFMASGCATVSNINESNAWLFRDGENSLLAPATASGLASALERLIEDPDLRERIVDGGLEMVGRFEWESQLRRIVHWIKTGRDTE